MRAQPSPALHRATKQEMQVRYGLVVARRLLGTTVKKIGEQMGLSMSTVNRDLRRARKAGLIADYENAILDKLVPIAVEKYQKALQEDDLFVAKDILAQASKIADRTSKEQSQKAGMSLQLYLQMRKENALQDQEEVIDALPADHPESPLASLPAPLQQLVAETAEAISEGPAPRRLGAGRDRLAPPKDGLFATTRGQRESEDH